MNDAVPDLSLLVPVFNEDGSIGPFLARLLPVLEGTGKSFEILFIDDGCTDMTAAEILRRRGDDPRICLAQLSRNFGKEAALTAGLDLARGRAVIPIDVDLQDPPEVIPEMIALWGQGFDVVSAIRADRASDSSFKRLSSHWFYRVFNLLSRLQIDDAGDFRLLDRRVVDVVRALPERNRFLKGLFAWPGFRRAEIRYERELRNTGETSWNWWKLWNFALDGITSFSTVPLRIWSYIGAAIAMFAFLYALVLVVKTLLLGSDVPGYASIMAVMLFLGGVQILSLGVIAEYVGRIFQEVKARPIYLLAATHGVVPPDPAGGRR